ncbi:FKBP-type peptidyl-prolyl cis-trans isomerase [Microbacterium sp. LRZ72]|uniref:FKBP-type peptidyl-prolyl cis-trans isomerase n=1 Tax=Microbacterium sp. LRZ72 TaxID=2942481 RepID=UPI0029BA4972|nr:FKBP-type peptidyl-prolyl cis-trans isomerase [Microbacterium sp. LRZ72]MDX2377375.1 FKBP-type peptidyl-prolyl cis-trans isomerase [Microbacterium sp. LRZ72]
MRTRPLIARPLIALSALTLSALALAGCTGSGEPDGSAATDEGLCAAAAPSGAASEAVTVDGEVGEASTASFDAGLEVEELQRTVITEGDGEALAEGDYVEYALTAFSADSAEKVGDIGYVEGEVLPAAVSAETSLGQIMGCASVGSRMVVTFPASESAGAEVYIVDVLDVAPTQAWGEDQPPVEGMPTVELAEDGSPTITIPDAEAPDEVQVAELKVGDGAEVEPGDNVLVQYTGVTWSDGEVFDSSWESGAAAAFATTGVVDGFRQALEGHTVGSQVLVVVPPEFGYGDVEDHELQDETLVFVVDILGTQHVPTE